MIVLCIGGWLALMVIVSCLVLAKPWSEEEDLQRVDWEEWERLKDNRA